MAEMYQQIFPVTLLAQKVSLYLRSWGQTSVRLEFQRDMSNSLLLGKRTVSCRFARGGGSAGMRGRKAQQW